MPSNTAGDTLLEQPGYNIGEIIQPESDAQPVSWAAPLSGQHDPLAIALTTPDETLAIGLLHEGEFIGYQPLLEHITLLRPPHLLTDRERYLYLAWSQTTETTDMNLNLWTTNN